MRTLSTALLALVALVSPGCVAGAAGAFATVGFFGYESNVLVREFDAGLARTEQAAREALVDLGYEAPVREEFDPTRLELSTSDLRVLIERHPGLVTRVEVRAGRFDSTDNRRRALLVVEEISFLLE